MNKIFVISLSVLLLSSLVSINQSLALSLTEQKITASDAAAGDSFGISVAVSGDTIIVGAQDDDSLTGSAYVFTRTGNTWTEQAKLTASDAAAGDFFGTSVAVSGDTIVVGAHLNDDAGSNSGSAYVFTRSGNTWTEQAKLTASDAATLDEFGISVAVLGDTAVVGANSDDGFTGSAYVFTRSGITWTEQQKLTASDAASGDNFGTSVAVSGDTAVVGANGNDDVPFGSGSAYVFTRSGTTWTEQQKLTASDAAAGDSFGNSVAVSGDTIVVGAVLDEDAGSNSGSAYVFTRSGNTWTEDQKLTASDAAASDLFGVSAAVSGDTAVLGAFGDDDDGSGSGSAYVYFVLTPTPTVSINDVSLVEGNAGLTPFTFTVTRSDNTDAISVDFATSDGTATIADNDYQVAGGTLTFTAGGPLTRTIPVQVVGDTNVEPNETFFVDLSNCAGCTFTDPLGQGTIQNDDGVVGGTMIPIDTTALLLAGAQMNAAWMIPVIVSAIGIGIVIARKL